MRDFYKLVALTLFLVAAACAVLMVLGGFSDRPSYGALPILDPVFWKLGLVFCASSTLAAVAALCAIGED